MISQRRRHVPPFFAISAACISFFVFVAFLSLLSLPLIDPPPRFSRSSILFTNHLEELHRNAVLYPAAFRVPSGGVVSKDMWGSNMRSFAYGCSNASREFKRAEEVTEPERYLMIATSGGLNQQRTGIIDSVVAARILNATLVVPTLDQNSFWKDSSNFTEIFDVDQFISSLTKDVKIIKELPPQVGENTVSVPPYRMRVPRKCNARCYRLRVLPALVKRHVVQLTKFDYRLSNKLPTDLQKLRCRVNYHALRFTDQILEMGETLIQRMKAKGKHFIALHLRFEPDMLAFSGCYYGGGDTERKELGAIRKRWKTLHKSNPDRQGRNGKCPLTPEEVGLMLRALGFGKDVHIYVASGEIYGGEETLAPLKALFPNYHSKETILSKEELAPFSGFSSRMAALDFIVCDESDVFVTNNNGNMAKILAGRRRYFGHKRTIRPNAKKLYSLFLNRTQTTWDVFQSKVKTVQKGFMGEPNEVKPGRGEFHEYPFSCICTKTNRTQKKMGNHILSMEGTESKDDSSDYEELNWHDLGYGENEPVGKTLPNRTVSQEDLFISPEVTEVEGMLSD